MTIRDFDILVAGAGPVGQIAAVALAKGGFSVALAGPRPADDRRTTALMAPALDFLASLGLEEFPADKTAPLTTMRILDATRRLVRARPVTFRASEIGAESFGTNVPNVVLNELLDGLVREQASIMRFEEIVSEWLPGEASNSATLESGKMLGAKLVVAADGRNSPARAAAGIAVSRRDYPQSALVLNFRHSRGHGFVSTEFHTETGPFTQVPLPGDRSSLVWVVTPDDAKRLATLDDSELSRLVEDEMQSMLGRVEVEPGRQIFPLSASLPATIAAGRTMLVGEAAHVLPPIGAQGMNLGIRDVAELSRVVSDHRDDPGAEPALAAYRSARRIDVLARSGAVDLLNRSLLSDLLPAQIARSAGLGLMAGIPPLREFVMREGLLPGSGWAKLGSSVREKVGRQKA